MKKENGITLVALVVTVIILLIIAGVAVSMITGNDGLFTKANEAGTLYNEEARKEAEWLQQLIDSEYFNGTGSSTGSIPGNGANPNVPIMNGPVSDGSFDSVKKVNSPDVSKLPTESVRYVVWTGTGSYTEQAMFAKPQDWYDYDNGKWANMLTTANGLKAYWVWIPRFAYKLPENGINPKQIDVIFVKNDTKTGVLANGNEVQCYYSTDTEITANGTGLYRDATDLAKGKNPDNEQAWIIHPAFKFGDKQLNGIWVAKYQASNNEGKIEIKDGVTNWRNINLANSFNAIRNMQSEGGALGTNIATTNETASINTHLIKNIEWGAVAALSQSKYGVYNPKSLTGLIENGGDGTLKVWNNPNSSFITGTVGTTADAGNVADASCFRYNRNNGPKASTTGTVYGIYDMAGSAWEVTMGVMNDSSSDTAKPMTSNSNFIEWPLKKYYDTYEYTSSSSGMYEYTRGLIGDLTSELNPVYAGSNTTYTWNDDTALFVEKTYPIFYRGGLGTNGKISGIMEFNRDNGRNDNRFSFRPVLVFQ